MKKAIVASILGMALSAASSYGQGYVIMQNYDVVSGTPVYAGVTYAPGQPKAGEYIGVNSGIEVELFYSSTLGGTYNLVPNSLTPFYTNPGTGVPSADGGTPTTDGAGSFFGNTLTISGYSGGNAYFYVQAVGPNVVQAQSQSAVFSMTLPTSSGVPAPDLLNLPPNQTSPTAMQPFTVVVPEPSILALSGIGAAALMLVRRKK